MKKLGLRRHYLFPVSLLVLTSTFFGAITFSSPARADTSCKVLLTDLDNYLKASPSNEVYVSHTTNYQANENRLGGYTFATLRRSQNGHLVGSAQRLFSDRYVRGTVQPFDVNQPDPISYDINPTQTKILFSGQYGPYDMTCIGNKFAIVNTWDSMEILTFGKGPILR